MDTLAIGVGTWAVARYGFNVKNSEAVLWGAGMALGGYLLLAYIAAQALNNTNTDDLTGS